MYTTYNSPPQGIGIIFKVWFSIGTHRVFFGQIDKIAGKYQPQETDVERRYKFLKTESMRRIALMIIYIGCSILLFSRTVTGAEPSERKGK